MASSTLARCMECGFLNCGSDFCSGISCKIFVVRHFGEVLCFGEKNYRFVPKIGSTLNPVHVHDRDFDSVIDFLYPNFLDLYRRGVK